MSVSTYSPVIGLKNLRPRRTLKAAFKDFYKAVSRNPSKYPLSTCWMEAFHPGVSKYVYDFDTIKNVANDVGWVKKGKLTF